MTATFYYIILKPAIHSKQIYHITFSKLNFVCHVWFIIRDAGWQQKLRYFKIALLRSLCMLNVKFVFCYPLFLSTNILVLKEFNFSLNHP